ncbi:hypothetical protein AMATHDRAFT_146021 [Amanita thiersii Skay4041]|uniref:CS domain-containing protein n=1 Tax=Amanita thiersii Skay4041 TaxID=703135 RepID=A0A2A9NQW7_9AGAR|nr:hypothetical protein AMATHDRAFT_146021 [Amanita thiersii Skay4041]
MPRCNRNGCRKEFVQGSSEPCNYHPGAPIFHEGLKSWSCCSGTNKPVLNFDEFMSIPGCTQADLHSENAPQPEVQKAQATSSRLTTVESRSGTEVYTTVGADQAAQAPPRVAPPTQPIPVVEEEDDLSVPVAPGTVCKRKGCGVAFVSDEANRLGNGEGTVCVYHPKPPIFREGSKGYLCCKRRVLEFEEFLKIQGCKTGKHLFAPKTRESAVRLGQESEEMATCRIDHYQTPHEVHVSVFGKQVDKERSTVKFDTHSVILDLYLPGPKRFHRALDLFGPIDPDHSSFLILNTKVELNLKKQDSRSWPVLEKPTRELGSINLTFGVGGRTGTVGAKEVVLDDANKARADREVINND